MKKCKCGGKVTKIATKAGVLRVTQYRCESCTRSVWIRSLGLKAGREAAKEAWELLQSKDD